MSGAPTWAREAGVRGGAPLGTKKSRSSGGGWGEADLVAESLELADEAAGLAVLVNVLVVEVRSEVAIAGARVGKEVPHDDEDGAGNGDERLHLSPTLDQTSVTLSQEGIGLGGGCGLWVPRTPSPQFRQQAGTRGSARQGHRFVECKRGRDW